MCPPVDTATQTFASAIAGGGEHEFTVDTRYVDVEPIGEGAYGVVCEAKDGGDGGAPVAIKLVRPTEDVLQLRCTRASSRSCSTLGSTRTRTSSASAASCARPAARSATGATCTW